MSKLLEDIIIGTAVGDALGVPVEFNSRSVLKAAPVTDMRGYGTHGQPAGTWSDDTSMSLCLVEQMKVDKGKDWINSSALGIKFIMWMDQGYWTPHGVCFDIGNATRRALHVGMRRGELPGPLWGCMDEGSNGNGSLMRILPLVELTSAMTSISDRYNIITEVSSITHAHVRSVICCFLLLEFARLLVAGDDKFQAFEKSRLIVRDYLHELGIYDLKKAKLDRLINPGCKIYEFPEDKIYSTGYVIHTLEAAIWCLLTTDTYEACVLKAVNLGDDTDTTGAVAGGLAGILYGEGAIRPDWKLKLARYADILKLVHR